ncbi:amino acid adenylation domain-containing protein [Streptomyces niveus]|uniref:amino acid adenylation domain-containing protein n=1 Tax=Streptomyces niveus TaxID=193462 RepID=UPI0034073916
MARAVARLDRDTLTGLERPAPDMLSGTHALTVAVAAVAFHYAAFVPDVRLLVAAGDDGAKDFVVELGIDPALSFAAHAERIAAGLRPHDGAADAEGSDGGPVHRLTIGARVAEAAEAAEEARAEGEAGAHEVTAPGVLRLDLDPVDGLVVARSAAASDPACAALVEVFTELLGQARREPHRAVGDCPVLSAAGRRRLAEFNATDHDFPAETTLHQIFRDQARATPDRTAVLTDDTSLTYAEVDERSDRFAAVLRRRFGAGPGDVIGVLAERSPDLPVVLLGVLKAGCAYLPLDPHAPALRIQDMVRRAGARAVVGPDRLTGGLGLPVDVLPPDPPEDLDGPLPVPPALGTAGDAAYVIYTSGSTGRPKGVVVEHRSVVNRLNWMQRAYPLGSDDTLIQKTPVIFDVSVWELFWWMFAGSRVYLPPPGAERFPLALAEAVERHRVTVMHFVPSMLNVFLAEAERGGLGDRLDPLHHVFSSGESLSAQAVDSFHRVLGGPNGTRLVNLYGPTETTVDVTSFDCPPEAAHGRVPIGRPIDNTRLHVMRHGQPLPVGVFGTLHVAGSGVARGYLGDEELTRRRFVPEHGRPDTRMYDTGDIARWLPTGDIDFLGRQDHQIKIRGIRVDLQEIEQVLLEAPGVVDCAVRLDEPGPALAVLRAAVTGSDGLTRAGLRAYVAERLPAYMVPATYDRFAELPRTSSGKTDRRALAEDAAVQARGQRL